MRFILAVNAPAVGGQDGVNVLGFHETIIHTINKIIVCLGVHNAALPFALYPPVPRTGARERRVGDIGDLHRTVGPDRKSVA